MIVGTLTLLALLFGGGSVEYFFLHDFDKGVKKYVADKDKKKEILTQYKESEDMIKAFNKRKKSQFEEISISRNTTENDFSKFFKDIQSERDSIEAIIIDYRITICEQITPSEWKSIVALSTSSLEKTQEKVNKKNKGEKKKLFEKTRTTTTKTIDSATKRQNIIDKLDALTLQIEQAENSFQANNEEQPIVNNKDASKADLLKLLDKRNEERILVCQEIINFHSTVKANTSPKEWDKIMKAFNKEMMKTI